MSDQASTGDLLIIRHGETAWSRSGQHTGSTDIPLTTAGEAQALALRPLLADRPLAAVFVSPRQRATRTAELAGLSDAVIDNDLAEWDYGSYEGLTTTEIHQHDPDWSIWTGRTPGGETGAQVQARADRVLQRIAGPLQHGDVAVVAHGHFGRVLAVQWLALPLTAGAVFMLEPACLCILGHDRGQPVITRWNQPPEEPC